MPARSAVVTGHVQGIGFRAFVQYRANLLGIKGSVWNRNDGAVELEFEHEDSAMLDEFVRILWQGPGHVRAVEVQGLSNSLDAIGFQVSATR